MKEHRAEEIVGRIRQAVPHGVRDWRLHRGELTIVAERRLILEVLRALRDGAGLGFNFPVDVAGVDYLKHPHPPFAERFAISYHLLSWASEERVRVQAPVPEDDASVPSVTALWSLANWTEREIYDLFGIHFEGHPDLRRILMWEGFQSHPLRKDYPLKGLGERSNFDRVADDFPQAAESRRLQTSPVDQKLDESVGRKLDERKANG